MPPNTAGYWRDEISRNGEPYMRRWYPARGRRLRYHEILRSDPDLHLHDHPWDFTSEILEGSYTEITPNGERHYKAGDRIHRKATDLHRLVVEHGTVWTRVMTGPLRRQWGFMTDDGWVPARIYLRQPGQNIMGRPSRNW